MLHCALSQVSAPIRPRVCAVSFLNTVPLVWGMLHGQEKDIFDLTFSVPSVCADGVARGDVDLGIIPVAEIQRLGLPYFRDVGIACRGPVRTILLISKIEPSKIRTLAADSSSRTSVMLARIILARKYGCRPEIRIAAPDLDLMLEGSDAALIIGDPALRLEPLNLPYHVLDLGTEWTNFTGLPMIFALWSGPEAFITEAYREAFVRSCQFGLQHIEDIIHSSATERGVSTELIRSYLKRHIAFELGPDDLRGLDLFWSYTSEFD